MLQHTFNRVHVLEDVIEGHFRLDHPEFGKMSAGFRFLSSERGPKSINLTHGHGHGLAVKLTGLTQISGTTVEIGLEKGRGALACVTRER